MNKFITTVFLLFAVMVVSGRNNGGLGVRRMEITQPEEGVSSTLPVVQGQRSCGGSGQLVEWRYETCGGGEAICQIPGDDNLKRQSELEFIPSQDSDALGVRLGVVNDGATKIVYEKAIANSAVQGGERYIMNALGGAKQDLKGKTITLQFILYRVDTGDVETCVEADFLIV